MPRGIREIQGEDSDEDFMGAVYVDTTDSEAIDAVQNPWVTSVNLNKRAITFKIDTGADVTVISDTDYNENTDGPLSTCTKQLSGPSREALDVCGQFTGQLQRNKVKSRSYTICSFSAQTSCSATTSKSETRDRPKGHHSGRG